MKFKNKIANDKCNEYNIGLCFMYYSICLDKSIMLSNDRKKLINQSVEEVQKIFSNGGKFITTLK